MNRLLPMLFLHVCCLSFIVGQDYKAKYNKVSEEELKMTVYPNDTAAAAVVLHDDVSLYYSYNQGFRVITEVKRKIKILKPEGVNEANITIPYFSNSSSYRDAISKLDANTYNLENGKIVTSKVEKKYIFEEKLSDNYRQIKFAFPNVKVGSVIEIKYEKMSDRYFDIPDIVMQRSIPVKFSRYETLIPEYFIYNIETRGFEKIEVNSTTENQAFSVISEGRSYPVNCTSKKTIYTLVDVPALKDAAFVWNIEDYLCAVRHELNGTYFPYDQYRPYANKWPDIEKLIKENSDLLSNIKRSYPYEKEIKAALEGKEKDKDKIDAIFSVVKEKIRWNGEYGLFDNDPRDAIKNGTGNNAQINAVIINALNKSGFHAYPILMSQRSRGKLTYIHPSIDRLSTYVVGIDGADNISYYLDGSSEYGGTNLMPTDLLVDRAYILDDKKTEKWVDLTNLGKNVEMHIITGTIDNNGILEGKINQFYGGQDAYSFKKKFRDAKDSTAFTEDMESKYVMEFQTMNLKGMEMLSSRIENTIDFTKSYEKSGDYLYINPLLIKSIDGNPFTESERKLPVEFTYPHLYQYTANITIPEGYAVSELPKSNKITLKDNVGLCLYQITQTNESSIQFVYRFEINQTIFPMTEYDFLRDFWGQVALKNNEMVVLKKI